MSDETAIEQEDIQKKPGKENEEKNRYRVSVKSRFDIFKTPTIMYSVLAMYAGLGLALRPVREYILNTFDIYAIVGSLVALAGMATAIGMSLKGQRRLVDVDDERERSKGVSLEHPLPGRLSGVEAAQLKWVVDQYNAMNNGSEQEPNETKQDLTVTATSFTSYFAAIAQTLEEKARDAEKKASILLDRGATYTKWGVFFFISSIVAWQVLCLVHEFRTEYIYGIASCSALFIFIEFLSAWFLRQYRHYVDTATYIIKIKSIFDRYLLVYLATRTNESLDENAHARAQALIEMLAADITWPDSYLLKNADVSFAKEAIDAISSLATQLKKEKKKKKTSVKDEK